MALACGTAGEPCLDQGIDAHAKVIQHREELMQRPVAPRQRTISPSCRRDRSCALSPLSPPGWGRRALRVELTDAVTLHGTPGVDYVDMPTFLIIPAAWRTAPQVDSQPAERQGPGDARAFAGIAYRTMVVTALRRSTCARSTDGRPTRPAPGTSAPSSTSPTQIGSSTGYARNSRMGATNGPDIGPDEWITLRIDIDDTRLTVAVNRTEALTLTETKAAPTAGSIGLFVDIGSESFFSNLKGAPN